MSISWICVCYELWVGLPVAVSQFLSPTSAFSEMLDVLKDALFQTSSTYQLKSLTYTNCVVLFRFMDTFWLNLKVGFMLRVHAFVLCQRGIWPLLQMTWYCMDQHAEDQHFSCCKIFFFLLYSFLTLMG